MKLLHSRWTAVNVFYIAFKGIVEYTEFHEVSCEAPGSDDRDVCAIRPLPAHSLQAERQHSRTCPCEGRDDTLMVDQGK
ncbi:MAG: hypothetical protein JW882_06155 [Deltaproteobacteria bacterium]|nr:hypothetical protein [Deltaproteobacteria bacterium]